MDAGLAVQFDGLRREAGIGEASAKVAAEQGDQAKKGWSHSGKNAGEASG